MNNNLKLYILFALISLLFLAGCTVPDYLYGHDNGEAYDTYIEQMEQIGIPPNGFW